MRAAAQLRAGGGTREAGAAKLAAAGGELGERKLEFGMDQGP